MARKRARIDWDFHPKKCAKRWYDDNDRISQLSDDILVSILCLLPMKEAARTSVLSSRWINLWKHISCLDFDAESLLVKIAKEYKLYGEESRKYVKWVNRVLRSHEGATLKVFRVCFDLSQSMKNAITQWLEFALVRHVESLELDFSARAYNVGTVGDTYYAFPNKFLKPPSQRSCIDFKSLKTLSLKCVKLTREAIEFFVHNCPLLEKMVVHYTHDISKLEVCGSSLSLKHLELCYFYDLESVKVSAPNLTSLTVVPTIQGLLLENVPMLVELSVNFYYYHKVKKLLPTLCHCISQMEILTLDLDANREVESVLATFPKLPKLKKLVIECWAKGDKSLMGLIPLIRASPCLQEFVLKLILWDRRRSDGEVKNTIKFPHEHLKLFKFCGYYGRSSDVEFVGDILDNCVALEKIVIDPCNPLFYRGSKSPERLAGEQTSREYAKQQLEAQVPKHIEFVIL